ncbi:Protein PHLOEM PROTEIN 2-LIKE like [Actinidia chinensis var. chinensis]|uniref:Protein PHLOEM PROTEIN 2-LIKE like n=1 Tax=Actinidia chinensis var. chinensis TaxID=1590841 RepID=A0A2R6R5E2_ACTCC|nr:Protein PHLOEM PROTEIN 2-LIKE like [Actinidia chinensis var. chinensis]
MDLELVKKGFGYTQKRRRWVVLLAALGFSGYGVYKVHHLPCVVKKREKLLKILGALVSIAEAVFETAEVIGVVSRDIKEFVKSDSDQIPNSLRQVSKITRSDEFSDSVVRVTRALTFGILGGYRSEARKSDSSSILDQVLDKLFSKSGSGFASVVVGSFARNLVMAFYSEAKLSNMENSTGVNCRDSEMKSIPEWVNIICGEKCKELIGDSIQLFVSTAVSVYLNKTMHINLYDEIFSGLTNPKHERKVADMLSLVCNGAVETLVRTSNQVLTSDKSKVNSNSSHPYLAIDEFESQGTGNVELLGQGLEARKSFDEDGGWVNKMSSTLAVPSNRKLVLDVTGRVTFETVRSFLEFLVEKLRDGLRSSINVVHEVVVDRGLEAVRFVTEKSSAIFTLCISLCLHILGGVWILVPA